MHCEGTCQAVTGAAWRLTGSVVLVTAITDVVLLHSMQFASCTGGWVLPHKLADKVAREADWSRDQAGELVIQTSYKCKCSEFT